MWPAKFDGGDLDGAREVPAGATRPDATNLGEFGQFASRRSTFYLVSTIATVLVVLVGLVAVNYVTAKKGKSWDLTTKKIFTLAPQTAGAPYPIPPPPASPSQ